MIDISPFKIMVVLTVVLVLLGPDKLPEVARKAASSWRSFKQFQQKIEDEVRGTIPDLPSSNDIARIVRNPVYLLDHLATHSEGDSEIAQLPPGNENYGEIASEEGATEVPPLPTHSPESLVSDSTPTHIPFDSSMN